MMSSSVCLRVPGVFGPKAQVNLRFRPGPRGWLCSRRRGACKSVDALLHRGFAQACDAQFAVKQSNRRSRAAPAAAKPVRETWASARAAVRGAVRSCGRGLRATDPAQSRADSPEPPRPPAPCACRDVDCRHFAADAAESVLDVLQDRVVALQFAPQKIGDRFARQVVFGGAEPARRNHQSARGSARRGTPRSTGRDYPPRSSCAPLRCRACSAPPLERANWCLCGPE